MLLMTYGLTFLFYSNCFIVFLLYTSLICFLYISLVICAYSVHVLLLHIQEIHVLVLHLNLLNLISLKQTTDPMTSLHNFIPIIAISLPHFKYQVSLVYSHLIVLS